MAHQGGQGGAHQQPLAERHALTLVFGAELPGLQLSLVLDVLLGQAEDVLVGQPGGGVDTVDDDLRLVLAEQAVKEHLLLLLGGKLVELAEHEADVLVGVFTLHVLAGPQPVEQPLQLRVEQHVAVLRHQFDIGPGVERLGPLPALFGHLLGLFLEQAAQDDLPRREMPQNHPRGGPAHLAEGAKNQDALAVDVHSGPPREGVWSLIFYWLLYPNTY